MYMNTDKNRKIEEILESFEGIKRTQAPDFFYTRLKARMEKELLAKPQTSGLRHPAYAFLALFLVLIINATVIFKGNFLGSSDNAVSDTDVTQSIAAEYNINSNLTYEINQ
jgi:hypothetical protein